MVIPRKPNENSDIKYLSYGEIDEGSNYYELDSMPNIVQFL